jgi:hypothetical protein
MIEDEAIATAYAIEAVSMFDHYHFRKVIQKATKADPLTLWYPGKTGRQVPWWSNYYDRSKIQFRDRYLFAGLPLPAGVASTKVVDWSAVDKVAAPARKSGGKGAEARSSCSRCTGSCLASPLEGLASRQALPGTSSPS